MRTAQLLVAVMIAATGLWLGWPVLSLKSYPHVPFRAHLGLPLLITAHAVLPKPRKVPITAAYVETN